MNKLFRDVIKGKKYTTKQRASLAAVTAKIELDRIKMEMETEMEKIRRKNQWQLDRLREEIELSNCLKEYGWIYIETWSRDCDMCESSSVSKYQSIKAYHKAVERACEWAEGPVTFTIITKDQYNAYAKPGNRLGRTRDRIMEAYENGNGSSIYV
jgi:hypothetical protein